MFKRKEIKNHKKSKKINKIKVINLLGIITLVVVLILVYKFNFLTKSEKNNTTPVSFKEISTGMEINLDVNLYKNTDDEYYIELPEKVNGIYVKKYLKNELINSNFTEKDLSMISNNLTSLNNTTSDNNIISNTINNEVNENNIETSTIIENNIETNTIIENNAVEENSVYKELIKNDNDIESNKLAENNIDINQESSIDEKGTWKEKEYKPNDVLKLSKEEIDNKQVQIQVEYDKKNMENIVLYKQDLSTILDNTEIIISGYIPLGYHIDAFKVSDDKLVETFSDVKEFEKKEVLLGYDVKILNEDGSKSYQPKDYFETVTVEFRSALNLKDKINNRKVQMIHINDKDSMNIELEKIDLKEKNDDNVKFITDEFSIFTLLADKVDEKIMNIYEAESDRHYWTGKNCYDGNDIENSNLYNENNIKDVEIQYYGYDYSPKISDINYKTEVVSDYNSGGEVHIPNSDKIFYEHQMNIKVSCKDKKLSTTSPWHIGFMFTDKELINKFSLEYTMNSPKNKDKGFEFNFVEKSDTDAYLEIICSPETVVAARGKDNYTISVFLFFDKSGAIDKSLYSTKFFVQESFPPAMGYVSDTELINKMVYHKALKFDENGNCALELIDNPFCNRPTYFGFNGWLTHEKGYTITTNKATFEQTVLVNENSIKNEDGKLVIKLYADWIEANEIFYDKNGNGTGLDPFSPTNNSQKLINSIKHSPNKTVSDRELNILVVKNGTISFYDWKNIISQMPCTFTGIYEGEIFNPVLEMSSSYNLKNDFQIDFMKISNSEKIKNSFADERHYSDNNYFNVKGYNLRLGRGISNAPNCVCLSDIIGSQNGKTNYKIVIESGIYNSIVNLNNESSSREENFSAKLVIGSDIDKQNKVNDNLQILHRISERVEERSISAINNAEPVYLGKRFDDVQSLILVKSGEIGLRAFEVKSEKEKAYVGIYVGTILVGDVSYGDKSTRALVVEGGNIANINGGLGKSTNVENDKCKTYIYVKGGNVLNIVGGAGRSETRGNRYIHVTDGNIGYSISGGSNGVYGGSGEGNLDGKTYVYVGGNAVVGKYEGKDYGESLYKVKRGSVLGGGNGNETYRDLNRYTTGIGNVIQSKIVINENATIYGDIYGGGNYGAVTAQGVLQDNDEIILNKISLIPGEKYLISRAPSNFDETMYYNGNLPITTKSVIPSEATNEFLWEFEECTYKAGERHEHYWIGENVSDIFENGYRVKNVKTNKYIKYENGRISLVDKSMLNDNSAFKIKIDRTGKMEFYQYFKKEDYYPWSGTQVTETKNYFQLKDKSLNVYDDSNYIDSSMFLYNSKPVPINKPNINSNDASRINIKNGNIYGNVFAGGNRNGINGNVDIEINNGTLYGNVYGGCNIEGAIEKQSLLVITGGKFLKGKNTNFNTKIFGGGFGSATENKRKTNVFISDLDNPIEICGNIYGGSDSGNLGQGTEIFLRENADQKENIILRGDGQTDCELFGGGIGANQNSKTQGDVAITVDTGDFPNLSIYGGYNEQGNVLGKIDINIGNINNKVTKVNKIYAGGNKARTVQGQDININVNKKAYAETIYGGGNKEGVINRKSYINVVGGMVNEIYGGSCDDGDVDNSNIKINNKAVVNTVFGGGLGELTRIKNTSNIEIKDSKILGNVFGGGSKGDIGFSNTSQGETNVNILDSSEIDGSIFGAGLGKESEVVNNTNVKIINSLATSVYGGGKDGLVKGNTKLEIENSKISDIYGGGLGKDAIIDQGTEVIIKNNPKEKEIKRVFGGGDAGNVNQNTKVTITNSNITDSIFGGGNNALVKGNSNIDFSQASQCMNMYGGGNKGNIIGNAEVIITSSNVNNLFGGGKSADVANTNVDIKENSIILAAFGGGDQGNVLNNTNIIIEKSKVNGSAYAGGNGSKNVGLHEGEVNGKTNIAVKNNSIIQENVFGAGKGETTNVGLDANVKIINSTINKNCYGGGDNGKVTGSSNVVLRGATINENAFAAGNGSNAVVLQDSKILVEAFNENKNTNIKKSVFGGGNHANTGPENSITSSAIVNIVGGIIGENVYGGGNTSVINGNTYVNIGKHAIKESKETHGINQEVNLNKLKLGKIEIGNTVFGGGENMKIGSDKFDFDSISVTGQIFIKINEQEYKNQNLDITIKGSIFGSGNASSAKKNGEIAIRNFGIAPIESNNYQEEVKKMISIQRASVVRVDNSDIALKGTKDSTSIHATLDFTLNRIDEFILKNNSTIYLESGSNLLQQFRSAEGQDKTLDGVPNDDLVTVNIKNYISTESHGEYPKAGEYIKDQKIYNSNTGLVKYYIKEGNLYDTGDNLIDKVTGFVNKGIEKTSDNRLYMSSGKNLNVAIAEDISAYGRVLGMTYFGIYRPDAGDEFYKGMFAPNYTVGGDITYQERDYLRSYVLGRHSQNPEQDITKDGFYTTFEKLDESLAKPDIQINKDNYKGTSYINYITPTPSNDQYYMWFAGPDEDVYTYELKLYASKFSTFGVQNLNLLKISYPNTTLTMSKVENYLIDGVKLIDKNQVPHINDNQEEANKTFGLEMTTANSSWAMNGATDILAETKGNATYTGTEVYKTENSTNTPMLSFYLQNSKNITANEDNLGNVKIYMDMSYWKDSLNKGFAKVIITVNIGTEVLDDHGYNGTIAPGMHYEIFSNSDTNITNDSSFSTYFELSEVNYSKNEVVKNCKNPYRVIQSDFVLPEGTTITMIDKSLENKYSYYYYDVTANDEKNKKREYKLSDFLTMGSTNEYYDEKKAHDLYVNANDYRYESFIFIFNFESAKTPPPVNVNTGMIAKDQKIRLTLKGTLTGTGVEQVIFTLLSEQIPQVKFGIYDTKSKIEIIPTLNSNKIYLGNSVNLNVITNYNSLYIDSVRVDDTNYFDKKLGLKISFINEKGEQIKGASLLGTKLIYDGEEYFTRADGTVRIKVADKVSNSLADIEINTENSSIESGQYKVRIESFGSADGIYFGLEPSDRKEIPLEVVNNIYGMKATIPEEQSIIDYKTGMTLEKDTGYISKDNNKIDVDLEYVSGLNSPILTVSLERRDYEGSNAYRTDYQKVDLSKYVTNQLVEYDNEGKLPLEYKFKTPEEVNAQIVDKNTPTHFSLNLTLKSNLTTGTYKLKFKLYDKNVVTKYKEIKDSDGNITYEPYEDTIYQEMGDSFVYIIIK